MEASIILVYFRKKTPYLKLIFHVLGTLCASLCFFVIYGFMKAVPWNHFLQVLPWF